MYRDSGAPEGPMKLEGDQLNPSRGTYMNLRPTMSARPDENSLLYKEQTKLHCSLFSYIQISLIFIPNYIVSHIKIKDMC